MYFYFTVAPIRERRFSDPEIILLSPNSPPPSSLFSSVTNKLDLPPPTPPRLSNGPSPNKPKRCKYCFIPVNIIIVL